MVELGFSPRVPDKLFTKGICASSFFVVVVHVKQKEKKKVASLEKEMLQLINAAWRFVGSCFYF